MGPLASLEQRDEVLRQVGKLVDAGGELVIGSLDSPEVVHADGSRGPAPDGAFVTPMMLRFADSGAAAVHDVEAFGPVSSIFGYDTVSDAVALVARGGGSLVTSVATHDPVFAVELTTRISAYNGRVLLLDRDDARSSTGHGSPDAAPRARRSRPGRRRRGARRHPGRAAPHAPHGDPGVARHADRADRGLARGRRVGARR